MAHVPEHAKHRPSAVSGPVVIRYTAHNFPHNGPDRNRAAVRARKPRRGLGLTRAAGSPRKAGKRHALIDARRIRQGLPTRRG